MAPFSIEGASSKSGAVHITLGATLWDDGMATALDQLAGASGSIAYDINNRGQVVGQSYINSRGVQDIGTATLWDGNVATDLNSFLEASVVSAGWYLVGASAINDRGQILAFAQNTLTNEARASVLTPVPEPETYAMAMVCFAMLWFMMRHRQGKMV